MNEQTYFQLLVETDWIVLRNAIRKDIMESQKPLISHREQRLVEGWKEVESSNLAFYRFTQAPDMLHGDLEVEFKDGAVYRYKSVDEGLVKNFSEAPSKGRFFALRIQKHHQSVKLLAKGGVEVTPQT